MVGSSIVARLKKGGFKSLVTAGRQELNLTDKFDVDKFFERERPDVVFLCAAKVGGIGANYRYPTEFILENLKIQTNVIEAAYLHGVDRLIFLGSSCIYPKYASQPITEAALLSGHLEITNRPYSIAKIAGIEMCRSFNREYGTNFLSVMPTNLYGPNDRYHPEDGHVVAAMIYKIQRAICQNQGEIEFWGTGRPLREFLHSDDLADACVFLSQLPNEVFSELIAADFQNQGNGIVNVGSGDEVCISTLATVLCDFMEFKGEIKWDTSKLDGTPRKLLDSSVILGLGWKPSTPLYDGLQATCQAYSKAISTLAKR